MRCLQILAGLALAAGASVDLDSFIGVPGVERGAVSCGQCVEIADYAKQTSTNATSMAHAIAALKADCSKLNMTIEHSILCDLVATAAVNLLLPAIEKGLSSLAWDSHATCAALGACSVPCCKTDTAPEQRHLSLTRKPSEMTVMWTTLKLTGAYIVQWGRSSDSLTSSAGGNTSTYGWFGWQGNLYTATMTDLTPATQYFYRVGDPMGGWSDVASFRTLASDVGGATPLRIANIADMGWGPHSANTIAHLTELVKAGAIDMLIHQGDIGYADGNMAGWDLFLNEMEPIISHIPYMVSPGNHEFWFNFAAYKHRFAMADDGAHNSMFYSLDVGNVHLLSISTESILDTSYVGDAQQEWAEADLAAAKSAGTPWKIAYGHRPFYCGQQSGQDLPRGPKYLRGRLEAAYLDAGVDLVLQGHVHDYERSYPVANGQPTATNYEKPTAPVYVINGAAGNRESNDHVPGNQPWEPPPSPSTGQLASTHEVSYGVFTIRTGSLLWEQFYSVNNTRLDYFNITK